MEDLVQGLQKGWTPGSLLRAKWRKWRKGSCQGWRASSPRGADTVLLACLRGSLLAKGETEPWPSRWSPTGLHPSETFLRPGRTRTKQGLHLSQPSGRQTGPRRGVPKTQASPHNFSCLPGFHLLQGTLCSQRAQCHAFRCCLLFQTHCCLGPSTQEFPSMLHSCLFASSIHQNLPLS